MPGPHPRAGAADRRRTCRGRLPTLLALAATLMVAFAAPAAAPPKKPVVVTGAATAVTQTTATLNATVNPKGTATTYRFDYGTTTGYGSVAPIPDGSAGSGNGAVPVAAPITGLAAGTLYHFRIQATNAGGTSFGLDATFTTQAPPQAPTVVTGAASGVTDTTATLNGTVNPNGQATTYHFEWGLTTAYGTNVPVPDGAAGSGTSAVAKAEPIIGLAASTPYHFRLVATNATGTTFGADATFTTTAAGACTANVFPTEDLQTEINTNPPGSVLCIQPGTHRINQQGGLVPLAGDIFRGVGQSAIVSGAKVVTGWTPSGSDFVASGFLPTAPSVAGQCRADHPLCKWQNDVFRDGVWLQPVSSQAALAPGKVFLNFATNQVYVRDDPTGHVMEQSWASRAFTGSATGVQIRNLTIRHTASVAQTGAVDPGSGGTGWTVDHNNLEWNHGYGVGPGSAALGQNSSLTITANHIHHNGQLGTGGDGDNNLVQANEVDHNNVAGYDDLWEAGNKFGHAANLQVLGNYYHDDFGPGIWCDIDCGSATISGNYIAHEWGQGIFYEISCGPASIHDNTLVGNHVAGIQASASKNVDVFNNSLYTDPAYVHPLAGVTIDDQRGIWHFQQARGTGACAEHVDTNVTTHDNSVELNGPAASFGGKNGLWTDTQRTDIYTSLGNSFTHNTYHATSPGSDFAWNVCGSFTCTLSFAGFQAAGQDTTGSVLADDPAPPAPPSLVTGPQP